MADFELDGARQMAERLDRIARRGVEQGGKALHQQARVIMARSIRLAPRDTGALRGSSDVSRPVVTGDDVEVTLSYGGPAAPYAAIVHEDLDAVHPVGQAKYLEQPLMEAAGSLARDIAGKIKLDG